MKTVESFKSLKLYKEYLEGFPQDDNILSYLNTAENDWRMYSEIRRICKCLENDYYKILEVGKDTTMKELKAQFRKKIHLVHPNKNKFNNASVATMKLQNAYYSINTLEKRNKYEIDSGIKSSSSRRRETIPNSYVTPEYYTNDSNLYSFPNFFSQASGFDQILENVTSTYSSSAFRTSRRFGDITFTYSSSNTFDTILSSLSDLIGPINIFRLRRPSLRRSDRSRTTLPQLALGIFKTIIFILFGLSILYFEY